MAQEKSIKALLKDLEPDELREVIVELCKLSPKNKQFLELYLQGSSEADLNSILEDAKKKLHAHFYGRSQLPRLDLQGARKVVTEYTKLLKDYPHLVAELKLYYVEVGTSVTEQYGDMYEGFYNSLVSMFASFCKDVTKQADWYGHFEKRIRALQSVTSQMGWGYGDDIEDLVDQLQKAVQEREEAAGNRPPNQRRARDRRPLAVWNEPERARSARVSEKRWRGMDRPTVRSHFDLAMAHTLRLADNPTGGSYDVRR